MTDIYAFGKESDLDRTMASVRVTEKRFISNGSASGNEAIIYFAKITSIVAETDDKQAKGEQVIFDASVGDYVTVAGGWIFDDDDTSTRGQADLYSPNAMSVDDVVEVIKYTDESDTSDFLALPIGGGTASRTIIKTSGALTYGAILENITTQTVKQEFTEAQNFKALLPWGSTIDLPDDYVFTADLDGDNVYYTETYPQSLFAIPSGSYPAATGFTNFKIYDAPSSGATVIYDSAGPGTFKLILDGFDFANASTAAKAYYSGLPFPVSFDIAQGAFYYYSPLVN